jgi:hypothetical protein
VEFESFTKIARLSRLCTITEKIDGTNAQICITDEGQFLTGNRSRWITPEDDNFGFSKWAHEHKDELMRLGPGKHFGEWWGAGIQRRYGLTEKRFSLFNTGRYDSPDKYPACCYVVPVLFNGIFTTEAVNECLYSLAANGSSAAPGFGNPEGVIIYHQAARIYFKKTLDKDEEYKGKSS